MDSISTKQELRQEMIARRRAITSTDKQKWDRAIQKTLFDRPEWETAKKICIYISTAREVDTKALFAEHKAVVVPQERYEDTNISGVDLFIVPGLAFDRQGYRLGRGSGYYDRLLASVIVPKIALAYSFQIVSRLPHKKYDIPMDIIISEHETITP